DDGPVGALNDGGFDRLVVDAPNDALRIGARSADRDRNADRCATHETHGDLRICEVRELPPGQRRRFRAVPVTDMKFWWPDSARIVTTASAPGSPRRAPPPKCRGSVAPTRFGKAVVGLMRTIERRASSACAPRWLARVIASALLAADAHAQTAAPPAD